MPRRPPQSLFLFLLATALLVILPATAGAHCDALDGPVVTAARKALEANDVTFVLPWVPEAAEPDIRAAFRNTLAVRGLNADARSLADLYFYETVVRVHRAGEGEPYTGLKPAGIATHPAIAAADHAVDAGSSAALAELLTGAAEASLRERFEAVVRAQRAAAPGDVAAGRRFVAAYVAFIHYVERLYDLTRSPVTAHGEAEGHHQP